MVKAIVTDFSRVLLLPKNKSYLGSLNRLHRELSTQSGYKLLDNFELNKELLDYYKSLRERFDLYIFTSESIQNSPEIAPIIKPVFNNIFSAMEMGIDKQEVSAYIELVTTIGLNSGEIVFIDDNEENIIAAKKAGLKTILFTDNESLKKKLLNLIRP